MFSCPVQPRPHFSRVRKTCEIVGLTVAAAQALVLLGIAPIGRAQTADPANPPLDQPVAANTAPGINPNQGAEPTGGGQLPSVVVTGYLIPRVGVGPQPVTTYDQSYIQKTGYQNVTDVLQSLPIATGNFNPGVTTGFSFAPAAASIALKDLGPNNTLVLVDGLRMPSFPFPQVSASAGPINFVDINSIPLAAIDRIEILNDGGSAIYGTDAVAGVVNLILKDQYQGGDVFNYWGISQRGDYEVYHGSFVGGLEKKFSDTSKLDVVAAFDFYTQSPINAVDRAFTQENFMALSFRYPNHSDFPTTTGVLVDLVNGNVYQPNPGFNGVSPTPANFSGGFPGYPGYDTFTSAQNGLQIYPRETRVGGLVKLDYQVTDWLKLYDSFLISRNEEVSSFGPNQGVYPPPFNSGVIVPANNPYNPFGHDLLLVDVALNEFGVVNTDTAITTFREVIGGTITLPHGFYIDSNWLYGESDGTETMKNFFFFNGMQEALADTLPGNAGQFLNPFADESLFAPNQAFDRNPNLVGNIWEDIRSSIMQFHVVAGTADLFSLPSGSIAIAGGFEYRSEDYIQNDDQNSKAGNVTAIQFPVGRLINARRYIWSIFGEADIPLLGNQWSWPGLRSLQLTISDRQDYYSDVGSAAKPKFAILYKPFNDFTVQASYSESFVAPSLPQFVPVTGLPAETFVTDPEHPQLGEFGALVTQLGNPRLKPETDYMYYVRGIWSPGASDPEYSGWGWANGFTAYIDWFQLDQHNYFGTLAPQLIVDLGSAAPPGDMVIRNPATGLISDIVTSYLNLGDNRIEGIEFGFTYNTKEYDWGKLELDFDATYLYSFRGEGQWAVSPNGAILYRVADATDTADASPNWKMLASIFYDKTVFGIDTFKTGLTLHYIGSELDFNNSRNGTIPIPLFIPDNYPLNTRIHTIGNWTTLDWQISYRFGEPVEITPETPRPGYNKEGKRILGEQAIAPKPEGSRWAWRNWLENTTVTFGINNVFDTRPPLSVDNTISNFDNASGSNYIQRYFWFSIDKKF
ncbi:MAG: TonB-dependent receptor [Verrucomicrobia bacterium]|nr:TonB-dependent receptor [Verrucomicrobiota bacterium]